MVQRAFSDTTVRAVGAHTLGHVNASTRVLPAVGTFWGSAGSLGFLLVAGTFQRLNKAARKIDYVFDTQTVAHELFVAFWVTLAITAVPLLVLRRNWLRGRKR